MHEIHKIKRSKVRIVNQCENIHRFCEVPSCKDNLSLMA